MKFSISLFLIFVLLLHSLTIFKSYTQESSTSYYTTQQYLQIIQDFIKKHKEATQPELIKFLDYYIPKSPDIETTYQAMILLINAFTSQIIPYTFYEFFAKIASLKFDFHTAALMYFTVYSITKNPQYLLLTAFNAYQSGDLDKSSEYLAEIIKTPNIHLQVLRDALILQSEIILISKSADDALQYLLSVQNLFDSNLINASFLYQLYRLSKIADKTQDAFLLQKQLIEKFPNAIETQFIDQKLINPLPLPSFILTGVSFADDKNKTKNSKNNLPNLNTQSNLTNKQSTMPSNNLMENSQGDFKVGYQVGAFQNLEYANSSLIYYRNLWTKNKLTSPKPILSEKKIQNNIFYQLIFPLSTDEQTQNTQISILKDLGIEGFKIENSIN